MSVQVSPGERLLVSVREFRVTVERVLLVAGVDMGALPSAVDVVLSAELLGADAVGVLERDVLPATVGRTAPVALEGEREHPAVDADGESALLVAPAVLDLACLQADAGHGAGTAAATGLAHLPLALGIVALAARRGRSATVALVERDAAARIAPDGADPAIAERLDAAGRGLLARTRAENAVLVSVGPVRPAPEDAVARLMGDEHTAKAIAEYIDVDAAVWWALFDRSEQALTPASDLSRLDTGVVLASGAVGAVDEY